MGAQHHHGSYILYIFFDIFNFLETWVNLNAANLSQPKKKVKQGEDDGDVSIQDGKEDKDIDVT